MEELILPTHRQIKKAIRFMPWGEEVYFFYKGKIRSGELVGFETGICGHDPVIKKWKVYCMNLDFSVPISVSQIFMFKSQALEWAMENTDLKTKLEK